MITEEKILAAGYTPFQVLISKCTKNWYKLFNHSEGYQLYQIVIEYWSFEEYSPDAPSTYDARVCFDYPNKNTAWIRYRADTIEEIEEFFANLFEKTGAIAYDKQHD